MQPPNSVQPVAIPTAGKDSIQDTANIHVRLYRNDLVTRIQAAKLQVSLAELDLQTAQATIDAAQTVLKSLTDTLRVIGTDEDTLQTTPGSSDEGDTTGNGKGISRC